MQFFHPKRYRFFYPAGLISLILLPLFSYLYLYQREEMQQKYVMDLHFWNPELGSYFPDPRSQRKFKIIQLDGNHIDDATKLKRFQQEILKLRSNNDTINGIQITFGIKSNYGSMVESYNICIKENIRYWAAYQNNLWIFHKNPTNPRVNFEMGPCLLYDDVVIEKPKVTYATLFLNEWKETKVGLQKAKSYWPAGILYLLMVALTAQKVVRQIRNQQLTTSN